MKFGSDQQTYKDTSWLTDLLLKEDDSVYLEAAARNAADDSGKPKRRWLSALVTFVIMLAIGVALGSVGSLVQQTRPSVASETSELRLQVSNLQNDVSFTQDANSAIQAEIDRLRDYLLPDSAAGLSARFDAALVLGGYKDIEGSGYQITFIEADASDGSDLVLDLDILFTVNGLFEAGARAVSINEHRVTATTSIRNVGSAVLVNFEPLKSPVVISAIGGTKMWDRFNTSDAKVWLDDLTRNYPIEVQYLAVRELKIEAATIPSVRYANRIQ
jgi:uncharacterized protein YlxW (UPF0749 family)